MKKIFLLMVMVLSMFAGNIVAEAAASLPSSSVWFAPASAAVGEPVTLSALVYNSEQVDATVTVKFTAGSETIATTTAVVQQNSATTVAALWKMPAKNTVVTAAVTTAVDKNKKSLPKLVGTLGTVTVGSAIPATTTSGVWSSIPYGDKISAWLAPWIAKAEVFRAKEATHFAALRDTTKKKLGISVTVQPTDPGDKNVAAKAVGSPMDYVTYVFATSCATLFANQAIFYIALVLIILLLLRFLVNLIV